MAALAVGIISNISFIWAAAATLGEWLIHSNEEVKMAVHICLCMQESNFYNNVIFKLVARWDKCNNVLRDLSEK